MAGTAAPPGPSSLKLDESSVAGSSGCEKPALTALSGLMSVAPSTGERAVTCGASSASVANVHAYGLGSGVSSSERMPVPSRAV